MRGRGPRGTAKAGLTHDDDAPCGRAGLHARAELGMTRRDVAAWGGVRRVLHRDDPSPLPGWRNTRDARVDSRDGLLCKPLVPISDSLKKALARRWRMGDLAESPAWPLLEGLPDHRKECLEAASDCSEDASPSHA